MFGLEEETLDEKTGVAICANPECDSSHDRISKYIFFPFDHVRLSIDWKGQMYVQDLDRQSLDGQDDLLLSISAVIATPVQ